MNQKTTIYRLAIFGLSILGYCSLFGTLSAAQLLKDEAPLLLGNPHLAQNDAHLAQNDESNINSEPTSLIKAFFVDGVIHICKKLQPELDEHCEVPWSYKTKKWDAGAALTFVTGLTRAARKRNLPSLVDTPEYSGIPKVVMNAIYTVLGISHNDLKALEEYPILSLAGQYTDFCKSMEKKLLAGGIPAVEELAISTTEKALADPSFESKATLFTADLTHSLEMFIKKAKELKPEVWQNLLRFGLKKGNSKLVIDTIAKNGSTEIIDYGTIQAIRLHKESKISGLIAKKYLRHASPKGKIEALECAVQCGNLDIVKEIIENKHVTDPKIISKALNKASEQADIMPKIVGYLATKSKLMGTNSLDENKNDENNINNSNIVLKVRHKPNKSNCSQLASYFDVVDIGFSFLHKVETTISPKKFDELFEHVDGQYIKKWATVAVLNNYPKELRRFVLLSRWTTTIVSGKS